MKADMNKLVKKYISSTNAIEYFNENISYGKTLTQLFLKNFNIEDGNLYVFIPANINSKKIENFTWSFSSQPHLSKENCETPDSTLPCEQAIQDEICKFLDQGKNNICIFEDSNAKPQDLFLKKLTPKTPVLFFEDKEVYYPILNQHSNTVSTTMQMASSWLTIALLTSLTDGEGLTSEKNKISSEELAILADRVEKVILVAFDGEGFLLWENVA